jgi:hypothetical protein
VKVPVPPTKTARKVDAAPERVNESGDETRVSTQVALRAAIRVVEPPRTFFLKSDFIFDNNGAS